MSFARTVRKSRTYFFMFRSSGRTPISSGRRFEMSD
jgi:hypothetical protein